MKRFSPRVVAALDASRILRIRAGATSDHRFIGIWAVERAYAEKYTTPGATKYVRGFRTRRRREATMEIRPR